MELGVNGGYVVPDSGSDFTPIEDNDAQLSF